MAVITVNVLDGPNIQADGQHRGVLEFVMNTGATEVRNVRATDEAGWLTLPTTMIPEIESFMSEQEIQQWIADINNGLDPAHIGHDGDNWFTNSVPEYNTWEVAVKGAVTPFLQVEQPEHTQALVSISVLWGRLDNKEGEDIAGKPNDVASEIQIAIDTDIANKSFIPLIDENGAPRI